MSRKQSVRARPGNKVELERKRDERAAKRALAKERRNRAGAGEAEDAEEFLSFANQLQVLGLRLREVPGDGNCLFRALGDQMEGHSQNHLRHRQETADHMVKHRADFEPFVEDDVPFDRHVENLAQPGTFAGNDAIVAFARNNQVNVVIHQLNNPLWQIRGSDKANARELHIAYRYGEHYDSVRSIHDNTEAPAQLQTEMLSKDVSNRKGKVKSNVLDERAGQQGDAVQKVRNATGCADVRLILQSLEAESYDIESTIQVVLQIEELKQNALGDGDADCIAEGSDCSYSSATWEPGDCEGPDSQRRPPHPQKESAEHRKQSRQSRPGEDTKEQNKKNISQKVSNKQRKEQQRLEKKKRQEDRHRQKVQEQRSNNADNNRQEAENASSVTVVKALSTLNI